MQQKVAYKVEMQKQTVWYKTLKGNRIEFPRLDQQESGERGFLCSLNKNIQNDYILGDDLFHLILFAVYLTTLPAALASNDETLGEE